MKQIAVTVLVLAGLCALSCNDDAAAPPSSSGPGTTTDAPDVPTADYVPPPPDQGRVQDGEGDSQRRVDPPDTNSDTTPEEDTAPVEDTLEPPADCNSEPGGAGCPCSTSDQCDSAACILTSQGKVCADFCVNSCPEGWSCQAITPPGTGADLQFVCVERAVFLCRPCESNADCATVGFEGLDQCLSYGDGGSFCGIACSADEPCPIGYQCSTEGQCITEAEECECAPLHTALQATTTCTAANLLGACEGSRRCTATGLTDCDAAEPSLEICDGLDNDCNNAVDEAITGECTVENEFGSCPGTLACIGANEVCQGTPPSTDVCDGKDNDCDGATDSGHPDLDQDGIADCVDPDDDGDTILDEQDNCPLTANTDQSDIDLDDKGDLCDPDDDGDGSADAIDCDPANALVYPFAPEVCDGVDNDCDNATDEQSCTDDNPCTDNVCDPAAGCQTTYNESPCTDANPCTENDQCKLGACEGTFLDCNDETPCTDDSCDPIQGCVHSNNTLPCFDGNFCTDSDTCSGGVCIPGSTVNCSDGNPCTLDACKPASGCEITPVEGACDDNNACTTNDQCTASGGCQGVNLACDDLNPCTQDSCDALAGCQHDPLNGGSCDDGNECTESDSCTAGECTGVDTGCVCQTALDCAPFEDGDSCNGTLQCVAGSCEIDPTTVVECALPEGANPACTEASCAPDTGECQLSYAPQGTACDEGDACVSDGVCDGEGGCTGANVTCDDGSVCTVDTCDAAQGCVYQVVTGFKACDDGNACTPYDTCQAGFCKGSGTVDCNDSKACTQDTCDPETGCQHSAAVGAPCDDANACTGSSSCSTDGECVGAAPISCEDNNLCTTDTCDPQQGCQNQNAVGFKACDDGNACTPYDACENGFCKGSGSTDCNDSNACTVDACDNQQGCVHTPVVGAPCNDGDACTSQSACNTDGDCAGTVPVPCNDGLSCTSDTCVSASGCVFTPNVGQACDDGNACTPNSLCDAAGACTGSGTLPCDDENTCTQDSCDPDSGCVHTILTGAPCDDDDACTIASACSEEGHCSVSNPLDCDDDNDCTFDSCNPDTGCSSLPTPGLLCDDGDGCTENSACTAEADCVGEITLSCDDNDPCTQDSCEDGACVHTPQSGALCDDEDPCTSGDTCQAGVCTPSLTCADEGKFCSNGVCVGAGSAQVQFVSAARTSSSTLGTLQLVVSPVTAGKAQNESFTAVWSALAAHLSTLEN